MGSSSASALAKTACQCCASDFVAKLRLWPRSTTVLRPCWRWMRQWTRYPAGLCSSRSWGPALVGVAVAAHPRAAPLVSLGQSRPALRLLAALLAPRLELTLLAGPSLARRFVVHLRSSCRALRAISRPSRLGPKPMARQRLRRWPYAWTAAPGVGVAILSAIAAGDFAPPGDRG